MSQIVNHKSYNYQHYVNVKQYLDSLPRLNPYIGAFGTSIIALAYLYVC
jgi:hypothetical protein